ncbi:hypothetical protein OH492_24185 [Vibrio chagasii]|nr:hypothetical protein [Vibrio chagasii]
MGFQWASVKWKMNPPLAQSAIPTKPEAINAAGIENRRWKRYVIRHQPLQYIGGVCANHDQLAARAMLITPITPKVIAKPYTCQH